MLRTLAILIAFVAAVGVVCTPTPVAAGDGLAPEGNLPRNNRQEAGIEEQIGAQVPIDLTLRDEDEKPITLRECIAGKPTILVPMYYRCPMLCNLVLAHLVEALRAMPQDFTAGGKFNVVAISFDWKEHGDLASAKKAVVLQEYGRAGAENGWRFLTGTKEAVQEWSSAVGYRFEFDKSFKEYNHPSGIIILTPEGKVARYFYGIDYNGEYNIPGGKTTLRLSLIEAADGKGGTMLDKLTLLCYRFEHMKGYSLSVLRAVQLGGILTLAVVGTCLFVAFRRERRGRAAVPGTLPDGQLETQAGGPPAPQQTNDGLPSGGKYVNGLLPLIPERASTLADKFEPLFWYITITTSIAGLLVYGAMLYFCVRYRRGATTGSTPRILGSERLEITWTIIPFIVFLTYFAWGVVVFTHAAHAPKDAMEILVIGKQWMWKAQYPNGQRVIIGGNPANMSETDRRSIGKLVLPVNRPVKLTFISEDVIHDFGVPAFRSKVDVIPYRYTHAWYHPTKTGEYHIYCDQYCGTWHSLMVGKIAVVGEQEFEEFLRGGNTRQGTDHPVDGSLAAEGRQLFLKLQCIRCHTGIETSKAPILEGLYGSRVSLKGGGFENVDEAYILESILKPRLKVVEGYDAIMPSYEGQVTAEDLTKLVQYIRSLKRGTTPDGTATFPAPVGAPTERPPVTTSPGVKQP